MNKGKIIVLSGPSGSGKTTLYKKLLLSHRLKGKIARSVSVTTRQKRAGEINGRDYVFVSKKKFLYKIRSGHFIEWQKVVGHLYGTPKKTINDILKTGKSVLLCIDVKGAKTVSRLFPEAISIFIQAPSLSVLKRRLAKRGSESSKTLHIRLQTATREMKEAKRYQYIVINDILGQAYKELEAIICTCSTI
jgi:guanylate kinase